MFLLLKNRYMLSAIGGGILSLIVAFGLHSVSVGLIKSRYEKKLIVQKESLIEEFNKSKKITEGVSNEYQTSIANLKRRVAHLSMRPEKCVVPVADTTNGRNAGAAGAEHGGQNGITTTALYSYAGDAEEYRLRLIGCQSFINKVWNVEDQT